MWIVGKSASVRAPRLLILASLALHTATAWRFRGKVVGPLFARRVFGGRLPPTFMVESASGGDAGGKNMRGHAILTGLASAGALETGYLTMTRLAGGEPMCGADGVASTCSNVLSGPFSSIPVVNIPLVSLAFVLYTSIAALSLRAATSPISTNQQQNEGSAVLFLSTAMATFSAYLMFVLTSVLQTSCFYCYVSAALSVTMAGVAWTHRIVPGATRAFVLSLTSVAATALTSALLFYSTSLLSLGLGMGGLGVEAAQAQSQTVITASAGSREAGIKSGNGAQPSQTQTQTEAEAAEQLKRPPSITGSSSPQALAIATRLQRLDAKMFGAYWCSHCNNQKQVLGHPAVDKFPYIECDKDGVGSQVDLCKARKVPGFPTWEIRGKLYPGEKDLSELEALLDRVEAEGAAEAKAEVGVGAGAGAGGGKR